MDSSGLEIAQWLLALLVTFLEPGVEASWWRDFYQWGLPRLVYKVYTKIHNVIKKKNWVGHVITDPQLCQTKLKKCLTVTCETLHMTRDM